MFSCQLASSFFLLRNKTEGFRDFCQTLKTAISQAVKWQTDPLSLSPSCVTARKILSARNPQDFTRPFFLHVLFTVTLHGLSAQCSFDLLAGAGEKDLLRTKTARSSLHTQPSYTRIRAGAGTIRIKRSMMLTRFEMLLKEFFYEHCTN